jgi:hypothetical protein
MKEDKNEDMICPCEGKKCDGGYGWKWRSSDLGNRHYVGHTSYKAGQLWVEVCGSWEDDTLPPDPPGITNIQRYRIDAEHTTDETTTSGKQMRFHNKRKEKVN